VKVTLHSHHHSLTPSDPRPNRTTPDIRTIRIVSSVDTKLLRTDVVPVHTTNLCGLSSTLERVSGHHQALVALPPENSPSITMIPNLGYKYLQGHEPGLGVSEKKN